MSYPGNPSLAPDVQQRILTTYRQSVQSAQQGNRDEALLGCDFVLRLDPQFGPARALQQMLAAGRPPEAFAALLAEEGGGEGGDDLRATFTEMLESRRFAEILNAAERDKRRVAGDAELRRLIEVAQSRYEADPYVAKFVDSAELAVRSARESEALALLEKARALDPTHPRVAELEQMMGMYADPSRAMGNRRRGISMEEEAAPAAPPIDDDAFALPDLDLPFALPDAAQAGFGGRGGQGGLSAASDPERGVEETSGRIAQLLGDGQSAFDRGEFQGAIDAWSRIFLIDIDHEEAARKIERARQLKAEREREVEEIFHDGVGKFDAGDLDGARTAFRRVLEVQPSYVLAREYLEKIDERAAGGDLPGGGAPQVAAAAGAAGAAVGAPASRPAAPRRPSGEVAPGAERAPREGGRRVAAPGFAATAKRRAGGPSPRFLAIGGGVLALLAIGGWQLYENRHRLFPNAEAADAPAAPAAGDPIARAKALHEQGKTAVAVAQLRRLPPNDPAFAEAQSLVSQWERIAGPDESDGSDPLAAARRRTLLAEAQQALADGENFRARRLFERAAEIAPLDGDWVAMAAAAEERLTGLAQEARLFKDGDYEYLLNQLWRRREAEPNNRDITRMIADAYFNLGVLDLQRGDPGSAREKFREARAIDGADQSLQRLERFAVAYEQREQDLLYRIFVKYLVVR